MLMLNSKLIPWIQPWFSSLSFPPGFGFQRAQQLRSGPQRVLDPKCWFDSQSCDFSHRNAVFFMVFHILPWKSVWKTMVIHCFRFWRVVRYQERSFSNREAMNVGLTARVPGVRNACEAHREGLENHQEKTLGAWNEMCNFHCYVKLPTFFSNMDMWDAWCPNMRCCEVGLEVQTSPITGAGKVSEAWWSPQEFVTRIAGDASEIAMLTATGI